MRLLIIEDDKKIVSFITRGFKEGGFSVDATHDGETGLEMLEGEEYDAAVVDLMLPGLGGLDVISRARKSRVNTPIIILSARNSVQDRVKGLESGGDDYLVKPFSFAELQARVQALIRRSSGGAQNGSTLEAGDLRVDLMTRLVARGGQDIALQPREFVLLEYFMRNKERVLSKTMIMEHVWSYDFDPQTNVVDVLVCRLRNKVDRGFPTKLIHTIRGVGYVLKES